MQTNSHISYTGLVEKYIGSAYDKVAAVSDALEDLLAIIEFLESEDYPYLVELGKNIEEYIELIKNFNSIWYGSLPSDPLTDPLGNPSTEGDIYFNTTENRFRVYNGVAWFRLGEVAQIKERHIVTAAMITDPWTYITVANSYIVGTNNLAVYVDGKHQLPESATVPGDYIEDTAFTFRLQSSIAPENSVVDVTIGTEVSNVQHMVDVDTYQIFTATDGQSIIELPAGVTYVPGTSNLEVYQSRGLLLAGPGNDYAETSPNSITLVVPAATSGTEFLLKIGTITSTVPSVQIMIQQSAPPDPSLYDNGQFWLNTETLRLYTLYTDVDSTQWISISGEETVVYPTP
ncbi:MAG: hypothetical protein DRQ47_09040 [Gammaproteobacteria bacterium]|nr:MAG: hypothetical protein DRQ47_09040 [Gammaproteobacteria bacterium]